MIRSLSMTRRNLVRLALAAPAAATFSRLRAFAAPLANKVKITAVKAMQIRGIAGNCLIRIDTDAGLTGYGEAGVTGPMARARIETMKQYLIGRDPMEVLRVQADARYPTYAQADITVETGDAAHHVTVDQLLRALSAYAEEHSQ